ncbi:MAG: hypothetical protein AAF228_06130 [Pseudomonadota bacterium]
MSEPISVTRMNELRNKSETAKRLSDKLYQQSMLYAQILDREIQDNAQFKEKLDGMARELAIGENTLDASKANMMIRDQYKLLYGRSPHERSSQLIERSKKLTDSDKNTAYSYAIQAPETMKAQDMDEPSFFRAQDALSKACAKELGIPETKTRSLMQSVYQEKHQENYYKDYGHREENKIRTERGLPSREEKQEQAKERKAEREKAKT